MLKELFQAIADQAIKASAPVKDAFDPTKFYVYRDNEGELKTLGSAVEFRRHSVNTIDDLAQFAKDHIDEVEMSSVFYNRNSITLFINDEDRRDRVTIELALSPQFTLMKELKGSAEQGEVIRALRSTLFGCFSPDLKLVESLRNLKWGDESTGESNLQRGKASIGSAIRRELNGLESIPEYIDFTVPVFSTKVEYKATIKCLLDPDEKNKRIILAPLPGQIDTALFEAEVEIGRRLALAMQTSEDGKGPCFLYHGSP